MMSCRGSSPESGPGYPVYNYEKESSYQYKSGLFKENFYRQMVRPSGLIPLIMTPHLGDVDAGVEHFARSLGLWTLTAARREYGISDAVLPPDVTYDMILKGVANSPQPICFPFKVILGSIISQLEKFKELNAEAGGIFSPLVVIHRSKGFCRERCYGQLVEMILRNLGEDFDLYSFTESWKGIWDLSSVLSGLSGINNWGIILGALPSTLERMAMLGKFADRVRYAQSSAWREKDKYPILENELTLAREQVASVAISNRELRAKLVQGLERVEQIRGNNKPEATVAIMGEIFHLEEFFRGGSYRVGNRLIENGVYPKILGGLSHYLSLLKLDPLTLIKYGVNKVCFWKDTIAKKAARAGLEFDPGGHDVAIAAEILDQRQKGTDDGIVLIGPLNCGPLTVLKPISRRVLHPKLGEIELFGRATDPGLFIPIIEIVIDEQAARIWGSVGTSLEAFCDGLKRRKQPKN